MTKDPAVLFYTSDFLAGIAFFSMEQRGQYVTLLCEQHQLGHIPENHMISVCGSHDSPVIKKFIKDNDGLYYNTRMENEKIKRANYCKSRSNNKSGRKLKKSYDKSYDNHMSPHMGNENINDNEDINKDVIKDVTLLVNRVPYKSNLSVEAGNVKPEYEEFKKIFPDKFSAIAEDTKNNLMGALKKFEWEEIKAGTEAYARYVAAFPDSQYKMQAFNFLEKNAFGRPWDEYIKNEKEKNKKPNSYRDRAKTDQYEENIDIPIIRAGE